MNKTRRICFCWTDISGYMAACWRELARRPEVDVHVLAYDSSRATSFSHELMADVSWTPLPEKQRHDASYVAERVRTMEPDVIVLPGWLNAAYRRLPKLLGAGTARYLMTMDTPWLANPQQYLAKWSLRKYLQRLSGVVVTGERSWQYAVRLGFDKRRIYRGLYGVDDRSLAKVAQRRLDLAYWPRQFLFVGRYAEEKGVDTLVRAYQSYRALVSGPWPLVCCGQGKLRGLLANCAGISDQGFCQPQQVYGHMARSAALVLPSRFDPWPLSLVEGCAAGMPVVCSDACGSAVEVVRDGYNGGFFPTGDAGQLARSLVEMHTNYERLPDFGKRSRELAQPYSDVQWADRWIRIIERTLETTRLASEPATQGELKTTLTTRPAA